MIQNAVKAVQSTIADIEKGLRGGGFSSAPAAEKPEETQIISPYPTGEEGRGLASNGGPPKGVDLRRYLPGGDLGPPKPVPVEIRDQYYGPGSNLFERIHIRYELKCRLGELYDCQLPSGPSRSFVH